MAVVNNGWIMITMDTAADAILGRMVIRYIRWEGITTAAHQLILKNAAGTEFVNTLAEVDTLPVEIPIGRMIDGVTLDTIDSGQIIIYLDYVR